ncbi:glycogen debranching N-terminal domain-containing protein [Curtobacterium sp. MCPF17_002]|uniref:glycogen debranching N-terminal domain-containing protein n=1 Tax=Curtobacterium sp. MCPF17_002 TaxID=2175645 RepID=UPI000DA9ECDF|nr:glycogen debranching N-terminal domain-containing protein [Curtobacterium sp. MCPF17_002]WIB77935.1 glycogen debranching N-terminal domain-containing protein [Curtobacterium sp. MCPF17_002]
MSAATDATVLVGGGSMLRADEDGGVRQRPDDLARGLFLRDCRALSERVLRVDGRALDVAAATGTRSVRSVVLLPRVSRNESSDVVVILTQRVDADGLHEWLTLRSTSRADREVDVALDVAVDAADPFALRSDKRTFDRSDAVRTITVEGDGVRVEHRRREYAIAFRIESDGPLDEVSVDERDTSARLVRRVTVRAGQEARIAFRTRVTTAATAGADRAGADHADVAGAATAGADRAGGALAAADPAWPTRPDVEEPHDLRTRARDDLQALRMPAPGLQADSGDHVVGAGVPWFLTLFGRDSLLTALLAGDDAPDLLVPVLRALAAEQATAVDVARVAEPGKLPHELRIDELAVLGEVPYRHYHGSVDVTPLFLVGLGQAPDDVARELEPAARAAVAWMRGPGGLDEHGFLRYTPDPAGLVHQGWKDSEDAVAHADGRVVDSGAIALCEVQGYAWRALVSTARTAREVWGDPRFASSLEADAAALRDRFRSTFWSERLGVPVLALDGDGAQVEVVSSNTGHLLWSGILSAPEARAVADRLLRDDVFSGWGLRTLATGSARYAPLSYHNGSVWPHDTAIAAVGMAAYGLQSEARRVADGLLAAAQACGGTLPELFGGIERSAFPVPVSYRQAARPQAWAVAAVFAALRITRD